METDITEWIERAHRGKRTDTNKEVRHQSSPVIIAKFCTWKQAESVKRIVINFNKTETNRDKHVYVEQLLSPKLAEKSNLAKHHRKELKKIHPDWKIFISHPAKVMCKKPGENKYELLKEF